MKHFAYVLYVGFHAKRNLCDKQNVSFYGTPVFFFGPVRIFDPVRPSMMFGFKGRVRE